VGARCEEECQGCAITSGIVCSHRLGSTTQFSSPSNSNTRTRISQDESHGGKKETHMCIVKSERTTRPGYREGWQASRRSTEHSLMTYIQYITRLKDSDCTAMHWDLDKLGLRHIFFEGKKRSMHSWDGWLGVLEFSF